MITVDTLPVSPNFAYRIRHNRPRYITKTRDRSRTSRVHGKDWFTFDLVFKGREFAEYETLMDFHIAKDFDQPFLYTDTIISTMSPTMRCDFICNFDSEIDAEPPSFDDIDFNVTIEQTNHDPTIPSPPPANLTTSRLTGPLRIALAWEMFGSPYDGFKILRSVNGGAFSEIADVSPSTFSLEDSAVSSGSTYQYKVLAYNTNFLSRYSNVATRVP